MTVKINGTAVVPPETERIIAEARARTIARARDTVAHNRQDAHDAETRANLAYFFKTLRGPGDFK
jgi:hypothetical protein